MTVLVITGATGTVVRNVVKSLLSNNDSKDTLRLLVRNQKKTENLFESENRSRLQLVEIKDLAKLSNDEQDKSFKSGDKLFVLTPSQYDQVSIEETLTKQAIARGVKHVVKLSVLGADSNAPTNSVMRWHADSEQKIKQLADKDNSFSYTFVCPNLFLQNFNRDDASSIKQNGVFYRTGLPDYPNYRISHVDTRDIGDIVATVLSRNTKEHANQTYDVTGSDSLNYTEVAEIISGAIGKKVKVQHIDDATYYKTLKTYGLPNFVSTFLVKLFQHYKNENITDRVSGDYEIVTRKKPRSVKQFFE